ncbi:MAG: LacI family transcriptional regulator [Caldilineae bacterium]|nr:MAG: LacI family transcriptional regulator [Caldilineae bacterium]
MNIDCFALSVSARGVRVPVTIDDISRHLGLSVSTVSKALNDYNDVSEATKRRVREAAAALGYTPSAAARNLRRRRTEKLGFSYGYPVNLIGEYASRIINGAVAAAEEQGYNLILYPFREDRLDLLLQVVRAREVDGFLLMGGLNWKHTVRLLKKERMPFVVLARRVDDPDVSFVTPDDVEGGALITRHLLELGHRRIAFVTRSSLETGEDRLLGYAQALGAAGIRIDETLIARTDLARGTAYEAANRLLSLPHPPTAIIGLNDPIAIECIQAIQDRGLRIPQDVAVAGADDLRDSLAVSPALTTMHPPLAEIGRVATGTLLRMVQEPTATATQLRLPFKLVVRASTAG